MLVAVVFVGALAGTLTYQRINTAKAEVVFREFPCASIAKPDRVVSINGFTFYVYVPLSHEGFLNMSIAERARHHPEFTIIYCLLKKKYLESHPEIEGRVKSALNEIYALRRSSPNTGWDELVISDVYLPESSAIYIGVPKTMDRYSLTNIIQALQRVALKYGVNIYLYNVICSRKEYEASFGNISPEELREKLKAIGVDDEGAEGYDWMTGRGLILINMSISNPEDPRIMEILQKITQIYSPETPCKEIMVVFMPYYAFS